MIASIYLEREDIDLDEHRYYICEVAMNLFQEVQLDRRWGRVGGGQKRLSETYPDIESALNALSKIQYKREKRGYQTISCDIPSEKPIRMIPKRYYPYLSLKIDQIIESDNTLRALMKALRHQEIVYVGDLVQLTPREIFAKKCSQHTSLSEMRNSTQALIKKLELNLKKYGLHLNSSVTGWQRPQPSFQAPRHHPTTSHDPKLFLVRLDA